MFSVIAKLSNDANLAKGSRILTQLHNLGWLKHWHAAPLQSLQGFHVISTLI